MEPVQIFVGLFGAVYWIVGAYLLVTGRAMPDWFVWPFKNPQPKRFMQIYGGAMVVLGLGIEAIAFTIGSSAGVAVGATVMMVTAVLAIVLLFGGLAFVRKPKAASPAQR
jgi:hypothetical protein